MAQRAAAYRTAELLHRRDSIEQPSIFDILAQESLTGGLRPAAKHLTKFLAWSYPNLFSGFARRFDEWYTVADILLQNYYLKNYSSTFSENFYEMKRVQASTGINLGFFDRWRSLIVTAIIPYVRMKLDELHNRLKRDHEQRRASSGSKEWSRLTEAFLAAYPVICAGLEFWTLILQLGYIMSKTSVHSPWLLFAGARLARMTPDDYGLIGASSGALPAGASIWYRMIHLLKRSMAALFRVFTKLLGIGLLLVQFLDYWQSSERTSSDSRSLGSLPVPSPPHSVLPEQSVVKMDPRLCPICRRPRQNDTVVSVSGYVYCYICIAKYLQDHKCCPVTKLPANTEHLVRLYIAKAGC